MKLLVTGATGQVGWELARSLMPLGEVVALDRAACDLSAPHTLAAVVDRHAPDVIVNAAAYTAVDRAESEPELAHTVNGEAVGELARAARRHGALLIHYSTDYVFDGTQTRPYTEDDPTCPVNAYGHSKLAGEAAIEAAGCDALILRTTWVYAARGKNFVATMLRLFAERERLSVVADQFGAPTWARNIADASAHLVHWAEAERASAGRCCHRFNLSAAGRTSWHGFATEILAQAKVLWPEHEWQVTGIDAIPSEAYPVPAARPANSCLDATRLRRLTGLSLPDWAHALNACLRDMAHR
ncbi:dTDP-4-dehydrorhamnose reductase [Nitrogeniibacter mangrovi]|uniref:dTDP-4-dehydrorhamnose reductase n=1 Tax=Nitrogeniibacter mangrovi TaxID=2016596 RepID=A0A6C1B1B1_9RHOO|nr:dTDP-4-dehydrorhamnose reductase [Nitrogeniibacter mangrovi]QID16779.1 dTDP-4-dehydrorhamnose reductase [Nitrogeniibacter mangrovi]